MSRIMLISETGILVVHNFSLHTKAEFKIIVTGRLHEPRHLEEDYPIIRVFFENKRFPSFFASGPIKFKVQLCKPVKILEPFELT